MKKHDVSIEYCVPCSYLPKAVAVVDELMSSYQHVIGRLTLVTGTKGIFDVRVDDQLIFSKQNIQNRHANPGEIVELFREVVGERVPVYGNN
jgi:selenoprotein W-related protein